MDRAVESLPEMNLAETIRFWEHRGFEYVETLNCFNIAIFIEPWSESKIEILFVE